VPTEYYSVFLGQAAPVGICPWSLPVPNEVRERIELMQGDTAAVRLPQNSFDIIVCLNVLMYLKTGLAQALAIQNMAEGLRSGGYLITDGFIGDKRYHLFNENTMGRMGFRSVERIDMERLKFSFGKFLDKYHQFVIQKN
jgi:chemotaxis methyl-accepting protein methylase